MLEEVWKPIEDFENIYEISNFGNIRSLDRLIVTKAGLPYFKPAQIIKSNIKSAGYVSVLLCKYNKYKTISVHRLVAAHFIPTYNPTLQVNHLDGNKSNNRVENLEWVDAKRNIQHAIENKLRNDLGSNNKNAKLNEQDIFFIRACHENKMCTRQELAIKFNVHKNYITLIINKKRWKHI